MGFSAKLLQSAARTPCAPMAHKAHTNGLRCIFCQVQKVNCLEGTREATLGCAPAENDLILFADYRRQTLRGFFDKLKSQGGRPWLLGSVYLFSISFRASLRLKLARPFSSKPMNLT